jgi:hypothetical protein
MEYLETDAIIDLANLGKPYFRTGSREICKPAPQDTDVDFVVLDLTGDNSFEHNGFTMTTEDRREEYGETDFETYRRGEVNLIVVHSWAAFKAWKAATAAAKQMNITDKEKRIALFQGVLYGNW